MLIRVTERSTPLWDEALNAARKQYGRVYGAQINPEPQYFVVIQSTDEKLLACAGITFADERTLFSEQYLAGPVEDILRPRIDREIERANIVEIGSLISHHSTAGMILVNMIPLLAWCMGAHVLLCTVTPRVRAMMEGCQIVAPTGTRISRRTWRPTSSAPRGAGTGPRASEHGPARCSGP